MKIIYTKIVGDLFHSGHVRFLKAARELGDRLVVHVVSDERVAGYKAVKPVMTQAERVCMVESCRYVDEVVWEGPKQLSQKFMDEHGYDRYVFACVDDQELKIKEVDCGDLPKERYQAMPYTQGISTTLLKERVRRSLA